jgi:hypothetical protein
MTTANPHWCEIRILYEKMIDPFETMALQSVSKALKQILEEADELLYANMGTEGVARGYWTVPEELLHEEKGYLIGNIFVLAQVAITQSTILFQKLRGYCDKKDRFPKQKKKIYEFRSNTVNGLNISEISLIDAIANYFKHQDEWPSNWVSTNNNSYPTMEIVKNIGMKPQLLTDNIEIALNVLGVSGDISGVTNIVQSWRETLASELQKDPAIAGSI